MEPSQATTRRKNVRQQNLGRILKISARAIEVEGHGGKVDLFWAQDVADLAQHFFDAHIGSHIARAVIPGKEQLQFFSRLPRLSASQHPSGLGALDVARDPRFENEVHHAAVPPRAAGHG
jgi:hypothetical protein